ncbi:murein hydrolase activator EnvC family protein [Paenibacillus aceris]|uniref:Murein DD-endopeptidase MepM/ murein hydrolase activator NlpD n=1 Tax=Paenibacillus aceris TaxID=869555 RepID=A0ABS4HZQ0_9BACL|nr:peptidoglycan DD-metalloendopeptidase family protein [Paenibacillus aceris]MBP1964143.1 murein DD-endopeptidase MepM/ murein hydrolase activator NlpD [Paenibacillus aceris]NHW36476.1 peptidoglycan DD-metalloendopeptidase family protein [Paenibacillus aceris]
MRSKKLVIIATILILFSNINFVHASDIPEQNVQDLIATYNQRLQVIHDLYGQQTEIQGQLTSINRQVFEYDKLASEMQPQIDKMKSQQESLQKNIADVQKDIDTRDQLLKNRLSYLYTSGNISIPYMDVLLGSSSFSDFINRMSMLIMVLGQDKQIIDTKMDDKTSLTKMKEELEQQQSLLVAQQNTLNAAKAEQEKKISERLTLLKQLQQQSLSEVDNVKKDVENLSSVDSKIAPDVQEQLKAALNKEIQSEGAWEWPVPSSKTITSDFGSRGEEFHAGIDIGAPIGTSIVAVDNGIVLYAGKANGFGNWVVIKHNNGLMSVYGHMYGDGIYVSVGQEVHRGEVIAVVGNDGQSTGPHLHFAVAAGITGNQMNYIDPRPYLNNQQM